MAEKEAYGKILEQMRKISSGQTPQEELDLYAPKGEIVQTFPPGAKAGEIKPGQVPVVAKKLPQGGAVSRTPIPSIQAEIPVPEEKIEEIKQRYITSPSSEYSPPEFLKPSSNISWADVAVGAIPTVLDALTGGTGAALGRSVDYYKGKLSEDSERQKLLLKKLAEIEKERQKQLTKDSGKLYEALSEKDIPVWMTKEQAIGSKLVPKTSSLDQRLKIAELNRKQQKELADRTFGQSLRKELIKEPIFEKQRVRYSATNDAINILNQRNPIGDAGVTMIFAKGIFGEVGNLTAQEQAKFVGSAAYGRAWDRMVEKYIKTGKLDETDRKDLLDLAVAMRDASKEGMKFTASQYTKGTKSLGFDAEDVIAPLLETQDIPPQYQDLIAKPEKQIKNRAMSQKQTSPKFPIVMKKGGEQATISNEKEYSEAYSEGWR